ncbi:MAG TPA: hypothetical protein VEW04_11345 [Allosphingosinicella sp.]|nr:hypothetical protein [Allosphingosinicella sp.]
MNVGCTIAGHHAGRGHVYNSGYYFSACRRCGRHLVRSAHGDWSLVPHGHRVVWKVGPGSHSLEADYSGVLPIALEAPAPFRPRRATGRALIRTEPRRAAATGSIGAIDDESGDYRHPRLLLAAVIVGAGLKLLLGFTFGR